MFAFPKPIDEVITVPTRRVHEMRLDAWLPAQSVEAPAASAEDPDAPPAGGLFAEGDLINRDPTAIPSGAGLDPTLENYTLTGDTNIVRGSFALRYRIRDPAAYALGLMNPLELLEATVLRAATSVLARTPVDDVLTRQQELFRQQTLSTAQARLDEAGAGIELLALEIERLLPDPRVLPAFQEVTDARVEARTVREQALSFRQTTLLEAEGIAYRLVEEARAERRRMIEEARGEAQAFLALARQAETAPELVRYRMWVDTIERVHSSPRSGMILTPSAGQLRLYLPGKRTPGFIDEHNLMDMPAAPTDLPEEPVVTGRQFDE
jgi:regulator of protease activity HflC (stomatin/prohibitin superfamily)